MPQARPPTRAGGDGATILVADHDGSARGEMSQLFTQAGHRVLTAATGWEALEVAATAQPELALLEVNLPGVCGYEVCRELRSRFGEDLWIVFLSGERTESFDRVAGLLLGADEYLAKPVVPAELLARVGRLLRHSRAVPPAPGRLTPRETEVLGLIGRGLSNREIGRELVISPKTVSTHVDHILGKLSVHSRAHAVAEAYRAGLVEVT